MVGLERSRSFTASGCDLVTDLIVQEDPEPDPLRGGKHYEHTPELPPRPFLYSIDQVAALLYVDLGYLKSRYLHYEGRTLGPHYPDYILVRNIAPKGNAPDWRCAEQEFARWLKHKGFRLHQRGWVS